MKKQEKKMLFCHNCDQQVEELDFCEGCGFHICDGCDQNPVQGYHEPEDHGFSGIDNLAEE